MQQGIRALGFAGFSCKLVDRFDDRANLLVCKLDGAEEIVLSDLFTAAFDHHDGICGAGDDDVHSAGFVLWKRRIADVRPIFVPADADGGDRLFEGNVAQRESGARSANAEHVGVELRVDRKNRRDDLNVVAEAVGEERANWSVDLPRADHGMLGGTSFALDVSSRNFSGGVHLLFKIAGQWKKVDAFTRFLGGGDGAEHDVLIAITNQRGAVCLLRQFAGFDGHRAPADR